MCFAGASAYKIHSLLTLPATFLRFDWRFFHRLLLFAQASWRPSVSTLPVCLIALSSSSIMCSFATNRRSSDEGFSSKLWNKFRREAIFSMYTPFVVSMASANLKLICFQNYIIQDSSFLNSFARAYEVAEECTDDDEAKRAISKLRKCVKVELQMHDSFVQDWSIVPEKDSAINPATVRYIEFLLATASGKTAGFGKFETPSERTKLAAYILGAMAPCMQLYAFLGKQLQTLLDPKDDSHPYRKWIDGYSSDGFQESAAQTEGLLDRLSVSLTGEELDMVERVYHEAMRLEVEFFIAQPIDQPTVVPLIKEHNPARDCIVIFSDFDLTCSVSDSCRILAEIAIAAIPESCQADEHEQDGTLSSGAELQRAWGILSRQYADEHAKCVESICPPREGKFNYETLRIALEVLAEFERNANSKVVEAGVLRGLRLNDVLRADLVLQDGCDCFFQKIITKKKKEELNAQVHILSNCWCADLIRSAFQSRELDGLSIWANELELHDSISTGNILKKVETPMDKAEAFSFILEKCKETKNLTVCIGDSLGDLLCLLQADIGIVIGSSSSLRTLGSKFGVSFVPLFVSLVERQKLHVTRDTFHWKQKLPGTLYTVSCWAEIHAFILGW